MDNGKNVIVKRVRYIEVPQQTKKELARKFGCVGSTVHRALYMEMDTPLGNEIRRAAMEMGGVFATKVKFIEC